VEKPFLQTRNVIVIFFLVTVAVTTVGACFFGLAITQY
jgi:hypothetical protein